MAEPYERPEREPRPSERAPSPTWPGVQRGPAAPPPERERPSYGRPAERPSYDRPAERRDAVVPPSRPKQDPDATRTWSPPRQDADQTRTLQRPAVPEREVVQPAQPRPAPIERAPVQVRRLRRGRLAIRKIDPWAVAKFSLVFYFCMLLIFLLATAIIFATLKAFGVIDNIERTLREMEFDVTIAGGTIFRWLFLLGLGGSLIATAITVFMSFLYNLIADVVGGIELLVTERE